jgi:hypothetical protein
MGDMSLLQIVGAAALASYIVLMIFLLKWWLLDDRTDRLMNHGRPVPRTRERRVWVSRARKAARGERRLNPGWETPSAEPPP